MAAGPIKAVIPLKAKPWEAVRPLMNRKVADLRDRFKEVRRKVDLQQCPRDKETIAATIAALDDAKEIAVEDTIKDNGNPDRMFPWILGGVALLAGTATAVVKDGYSFTPLSVVLLIAGAATALAGLIRYLGIKDEADRRKKQNDITAEYDSLIALLRSRIHPDKHLEAEDGTHMTGALGHKADFERLERFTEQLLDMTPYGERTGWMLVEHIYDTINQHGALPVTPEYREALAFLKKRADHVRAAQDRAETEAKSTTTKNRTSVRVSTTDDQPGTQAADVTDPEEEQRAAEPKRKRRGSDDKGDSDNEA